ncbi:hypothetical protein [Cupriavidus basilensis]
MAILDPDFMVLLGKAAAWLKPKAIARGKVLNSERKAYAGTDVQDLHGIKESFSETYKRLLGGTGRDPTPAGKLAAIEKVLVVPEHLRKPAIQDWLTDTATRTGLFALAECKLFERPEKTDVRVDLASTYAERTGKLLSWRTELSIRSLRR